MRRLAALLLAGILLIGGAFAAAEEDADIFSWDFVLRFHLNTDVFTFREKAHMQGYADLLDALELRGNCSWCPGTNSLELRGEVIPVANPSAGISFRVAGFPELLQVSSPVLGGEAVWFEPARFMYFAERTWEAMQIPLPYLALLIPGTTVDAFQCLIDAWNAEAGPMDESHAVSAEAVERIAEIWRKEVEHNNILGTWVDALTNFLPESGPVEQALNELPDLLLALSAGEDLTIEAEESTEGRTLRCLNAGEITLFEEHDAGQEYSCSLILPETGVEYTPFLSFRKTEENGILSLALLAAWDRSPDVPAGEDLYDTGFTMPESILQARLEAENLPLRWPLDSGFSGRISIDGYLLPNFHYLISGSSSANGELTLCVTMEEKQEAGPAFTCTGMVVPVEREKRLAYTEYELKTEYNLFGLNDESLHRLVNSIFHPFLNGMIDFLYELPASSCQSIMDALESYGIIQTLLK